MSLIDEAPPEINAWFAFSMLGALLISPLGAVCCGLMAGFVVWLARKGERIRREERKEARCKPR